MQFTQPIHSLIQQRISIRGYQENSMNEDQRLALTESINSLPAGPFSNPSRFMLVASSNTDGKSLRGMGTYGFIHGTPGFIIGATASAPQDLEDFGYRMELLVLRATDLGLGTCWLGGTFNRSGFAHKIAVSKDEIIPIVTAVGKAAAAPGALENAMRRNVRARDRLPWDQLFFNGKFGVPLTAESAGAYANLLEMVRIGPSASNKQPWRVVRHENFWHFYIQRTPGYRENLLTRLLGVADMQRVDLGISMAHFELSAREAGLKGSWQVQDPGFPKPNDLTEYSVTWQAQLN